MDDFQSASIFSLLKKFLTHLSLVNKRQLFGTFIVTLISAALDVSAVGSVMPFLWALANPDRLFSQAWLHPFIQLFGLQMPADLLLPLCILFTTLFVCSGLIRLLLLWMQTRASFLIGAEVSDAIYRRTLFQPYSVHISRNSSEIIAGITSKANAIAKNIMLPILTLITSFSVVLGMLFLLLLSNSIIAVTIFFGFGLMYCVIIFFEYESIYSSIFTYLNYA